MVHILLRDPPESQSNAPALKQSPRATHPDRVSTWHERFSYLTAVHFRSEDSP